MMKKQQIKQILILILFIFWTIAGYSQQKGSIYGKVSDAENNKSLEGASIVLLPIQKGAATNMDGEYIVENLDPGTFTLEVTYLGYRKFSKKITIKAGVKLNMNITLYPTYFELSEVVVKDWAQKHVPYVKSELSKIEIEATSAFDLGDYLRNVPNVSAIRKGGSQLDPVIRGFKYDQLNVRIDGFIRIEGGCPNRMDPNVAHVEIDDIERIEVLKGPYALLYGPVGGGALIIHTTKPTPFSSKKFELTARGIKSYESNWHGTKDKINIKAGNNRIYFNFSGSSQDYGSYRDGNGNTVPSYFRKYSFTAEAALKIKENHELMYSFVSSQGRDVKFLVLPMDERIDNTKLNTIVYTITSPSDRIEKIAFSAYNSDVYHEMDTKEKPIGDSVVAISALDAIVNYMDGTINLKIGENGKMAVRQSYEQTTKAGDKTRLMYKQMLTQQNAIPIITDPLFDAKYYNIGTAMEYEWKKGTISMTGAFRFDYNASNSDTMFIKNKIGTMEKIVDTIAALNNSAANFSASFGINKYLNENLTLSFALGRGVRSPNILERYVNFLPVGYDRFDYLGNPDLKPEANHQADLTLKYETSKIGRFTLNGFFSAVTNYIAAKEVPPAQYLPLSSGVIGVKQFYNADLVYFRGFEFTFTTPFEYNFGASLVASYTKATMSKAWNRMTIIENDPLYEVPPFEARFQAHYKLFNNKLVPRVNVRFVAPQNYVSIAYGEKETEGFWTADAGITYAYNKILSVSGGVRNITDEAYYEHLNRRMVTGGNFYEPGRVFYISIIAKI